MSKKIGRPPLPPSERRQTLSITLNPQTIEALDWVAEKTGANRSTILEKWFAQGLNHRQAIFQKSGYISINSQYLGVSK